jgi:nucleoid-associated protein YgaU
LVPDFGASDSTRTAVPTVLGEASPPRPTRENAPIAVPAAAAEPPGTQKQLPWSAPPRAKLRNEAPRPLAFDAPSAASPVEQLSPPAPANVATSMDVEPPAEAQNWGSRQSPPDGFEQVAASPPTIVASYREAADSTASITPIGPPPWPRPTDGDLPRTHVVVDGDSLARLAGRYLDDPRRSDEIFEANRGLLSDPDLLPIGVELVIPSRAAASSAALESPQSFRPRAVAAHAAAAGGLVPVRPIPSSTGAVPRAQLTRPVPVE